MAPTIPVLELPLVPVAAVLGALVGSFLNVVIARLPAGESIAFPGSRCPHCHDAIPWYLNVPILSWIVLRGRCRACKAPISVRYPIVEALTAVLFVAVAVRFGAEWATPVGWLFAGSLVAITFVDIDIWEIPDEISLPGIVLGCVLRPLTLGAPWWSGLAGAAMGALALGLIRWFYLVFRDVEGMGLGDVKLIAMIGAFVGVGGLLPVILIASISGTIIGGALLLFGPKPSAESAPDAEAALEAEATPPSAEEEEEWEPPENAVPFGPFLALGALAQLLVGPALEQAVLRWAS